ncbi:hypothetical protein D1007_42121 [Hordeum vulgare]|nr:hypothetical protein D1007_42121 [Hordeum vulgare]
MIRQDFSIPELHGISRHQFAWQWLPASGQCGGILLGVQKDYFSVKDMHRGEFFLSMSITDRRVNLNLAGIIVYGPMDHGSSADFLDKLKSKVEQCTTLVVVARDFKLIRWACDMSSPNLDRMCMHLFNDFIADLVLWDIAIVGRYTWTNKQVDPIRSVVDRVFISAQWELRFPFGFDHAP